MTQEENYEQLWECFLSDQMTVAQLEHHLADDGGFKSFVERKIIDARSRAIEETGNL